MKMFSTAEDEAGMSWLVGLLCLLAPGLSVQLDYNLTATTETTDHSKARSLEFIGRQDIMSYQSSYYPGGPYPPAPYPPPTYGPPTATELPPGMVQIEFAFDEIVLRCIAEEPYEHIVWTRYQCPQQFLFGSEGTHVADGSQVYQDNLYDVHIRGHDGTIVSELLIKQPLADSSEGIYQCEVWPHIHGGNGYSPYNPYQSLMAPKSDVFIIGGNSLLADCYHVSNLSPQASKLKNFNKQGADKKDNKPSTLDFSSLKPRRNDSESSRKDTNSKQLRYNLKYMDNILYNVDGVNVTVDFFRPSSSLYFNKSKLTNVQSSQNNLSSLSLETGRSNDKYREIFPKINHRQAKTTNLPWLNNSHVTKL